VLFVCLQQVWAGQQYVGGQQVMQLQLAAQQQQPSAGGGGVQELYANGYVDSAAVLGSTGVAAQKQMSASRDRQSTADYRLEPEIVAAEFSGSYNGMLMPLAAFGFSTFKLKLSKFM
jgi:hypothetical protein